MAEREEKKGFWARLFGGSGRSIRQDKVLQYIVHRMNEGANLQDVVEEEYVRRNASRNEIDQTLSDPEVIEAARERMQKDFSSGDLDPNQRPQ